MPDDSDLLQPFFKDDRDIEISSLPDAQEIKVISGTDHVLFPTVLTSGRRVLCRLRLTDRGMFLLGLATLDVGEIKAAETTMGLKEVAGGIAGAESANANAERVQDFRTEALTKYDAALRLLEGDDPRGHFSRRLIPLCSFAGRPS